MRTVMCRLLSTLLIAFAMFCAPLAMHLGGSAMANPTEIDMSAGCAGMAHHAPHEQKSETIGERATRQLRYRRATPPPGARPSGCLTLRDLNIRSWLPAERIQGLQLSTFRSFAWDFRPPESSRALRRCWFSRSRYEKKTPLGGDGAWSQAIHKDLLRRRSRTAAPKTPTRYLVLSLCTVLPANPHWEFLIRFAGASSCMASSRCRLTLTLRLLRRSDIHGSR
jgi:hypothetical protein